MSAKANDERVDFSRRLNCAAFNAGVPLSPTRFAKAFNARAHGCLVTVHGARKWLRAEAIPTQEKMVVLAGWLGVGAAWLRFGDAEIPSPLDRIISEASLSSDDLDLVQSIASLPESARRSVREIVDVMVRNFGASQPSVMKAHRGPRFEDQSSTPKLSNSSVGRDPRR